MGLIRRMEYMVLVGFMFSIDGEKFLEHAGTQPVDYSYFYLTPRSSPNTFARKAQTATGKR